MIGNSNETVVIVGAGPAGLAAASSLKRQGYEPLVLERGQRVATRWQSYYARLHLNTSKRLSRLPGLDFDRHVPRWPARSDVIDYLERFARFHEITPTFGVEVKRIDRVDGGFDVVTGQGGVPAGSVVVATGQSERPYLPAWSGRESFDKPIVHVSAYVDASPYVGKEVLVVGAGDSASDVAVDLVEAGAACVWLSVRTSPHIVPRQLLGIPADVSASVVSKFPPRLVDPILGWMERVVVGDLTPYGLGRPSRGLYAHHRYDRRAPIIDPGHFVEYLRSRSIKPVAAVTAFERDAVILADGSLVQPDAVISATGYSPGLEAMVGHLGVLAPDGYPLYHAPRSHPAVPLLFFLGFRYPFAGNFRQIRIDAPKMARRINRLSNEHA